MPQTETDPIENASALLRGQFPREALHSHDAEHAVLTWIRSVHFDVTGEVHDPDERGSRNLERVLLPFGQGLGGGRCGE